MRDYMMLLAASVMLLTGCAEKTYSGDVEDNKGASVTLPVKVAAGSPSVKGGYAVDGLEDMEGKDFYVYAFRKNDKASYTVTSASDPSVCLIDASSDGTVEQVGGKAARLTGAGFYAEWTGNKVNWRSGENHKDAYDFFAYFIDDAVPSRIIREDDRVAVELTMDGSQDIMLSKAALTASQLSGLNAADRDKAIACSYSHFTAFRNISPVFTFEHQLVRLDFESVAGDVEGISVLSARKARLTVAHKDESELGIAFTDNVASMNDGAASGYALRLPDIGGSSLMVAPSDSYRVFVTVNENGVRKTVSAEMDHPSQDGRFASGECYAVRLTVDGTGGVDIETELK